MSGRERAATALMTAWLSQPPRYLLETNVPGIFACGDVCSGPVKRVASAVGEGSLTIAFVHHYLRETGAMSTEDIPREASTATS